MVMCWPNGIKPGGIIHQARHVTDIMPTILDVSGAQYPADFDGHGIQNLDGESLMPLFHNTCAERQQPIYWEHEGNCAMRDGDWKLVKVFGEDWELYNMRVDRTELFNLREKNAPQAKKMIKGITDAADEEEKVEGVDKPLKVQKYEAIGAVSVSHVKEEIEESTEELEEAKSEKYKEKITGKYDKNRVTAGYEIERVWLRRCWGGKRYRFL